MGYQEFLLKTSVDTVYDDITTLANKIYEANFDDVLIGVVSKLKTDITITPYDSDRVVDKLKKGDLFIVVQGERAMGRRVCETIPNRTYYQLETLMRCSQNGEGRFLAPEIYEKVFKDYDSDDVMKDEIILVQENNKKNGKEVGDD